MKVALRSLALLLLSSSPETASAQDVIFVVDVGPATLDVDALRERIAAEADRELVRLGDELSRHATETLTIVHAGEGRWVFRHQRGGEDVRVECAGVESGDPIDALVSTATGLLHTPAPRREPPSVWDELYGTRPGYDLIDPFAGHWGPSSAILHDERVQAVIGRSGMVYVDLTDPFAREPTTVHLMDPWLR